MAQQQTIKGLGTEIVEEFLTAAKLCVETRKADGGILGYPAILLLLSITDAIGHGLDVGSGDTRLTVLKHPPFRELLAKSAQELSPKHVKNLTQWYRHMLAHSGLIAPGVALTPDADGAPFDFSGEELTLIRVPVLYQLVRDAWDGLKDTFTPRFRPGQEKGWPKTPALLGVMSAASGITEAQFVTAIRGQIFVDAEIANIASFLRGQNKP
jgi:hypothetical protein